jgi:anti-anti-sigma factor
MRITVEPRESFTILHLRGEFDTFYCPHLQKEIDSLVATGVSRIALNLRLVKFINSTALGAIIKASRRLSADGGQLVISRPSNFCRDIIEKVGLDRIVPIHDSDEDAGQVLIEGVESIQKGDVEDDDPGTAGVPAKLEPCPKLDGGHAEPELPDEEDDLS